ncbi:VOC family protein [Enterovibrio norvegicus]|uniref:VOC family protein n=1 Tax=Enterovibrio norvegicus TaxID=188144 RepID=UPI000C86628B|nr:VOC family protein [Enterovibrio norvegicus]PML82137.1 hypothetical protein BCT69_01995 [Enterovibrio norvegicus]
MNNSFVWTDLSTFDISAAKRFYHACFDWAYQDMGDGNTLSDVKGTNTAALYTMPEQFQKIKMPSFWMSYIHVSDIEQVVLDAEKHGAKVELKPQPGPSGGRIALIRDPAGAGFTCFEGEIESGRSLKDEAGRMVWNELHVSDLQRVKSFYENVFGWHIKASSVTDRYDIFTSSAPSQPIAGIQVTSNALKGDKEYWGVYFCVDSLEETSNTIEQAGGEIVAEQALGERPALLAYDSQGAAFYIVERDQRAATTKRADNHSASSDNGGSTTKWRAIAGLLLVAVAIVLDANWVWGGFFLLWLIPDLKSGVTHFMERIARRENPLLYWLIMAVWICLSVYLLAEPFAFV